MIGDYFLEDTIACYQARNSPYEGVLEAGGQYAELYEKYGRELNVLHQKKKELLLEMICEIVASRFSDLASKSIPANEMKRKGLISDEPIDYSDV